MDEAIEHQRFEWCIKLKTMLAHLDQWTEKQHVVFAPEYQGIIVSITALQNYWIVIVVKIYNGKVTDIIREKKLQDERSYNQIQSSLSLDLDRELYEYAGKILLQA